MPFLTLQLLLRFSFYYAPVSTALNFYCAPAYIALPLILASRLFCAPFHYVLLLDLRSSFSYAHVSPAIPLLLCNCFSGAPKSSTCLPLVNSIFWRSHFSWSYTKILLFLRSKIIDAPASPALMPLVLSSFFTLLLHRRSYFACIFWAPSSFALQLFLRSFSM